MQIKRMQSIWSVLFSADASFAQRLRSSWRTKVVTSRHRIVSTVFSSCLSFAGRLMRTLYARWRAMPCTQTKTNSDCIVETLKLIRDNYCRTDANLFFLLSYFLYRSLSSNFDISTTPLYVIELDPGDGGRCGRTSARSTIGRHRVENQYGARGHGDKIRPQARHSTTVICRCHCSSTVRQQECNGP